MKSPRLCVDNDGHEPRRNRARSSAFGSCTPSAAWRSVPGAKCLRYNLACAISACRLMNILAKDREKNRINAARAKRFRRRRHWRRRFLRRRVADPGRQGCDRSAARVPFCLKQSARLSACPPASERAVACDMRFSNSPLSLFRHRPIIAAAEGPAAVHEVVPREVSWKPCPDSESRAPTC
jgi:hypothetical protein